MQPPRFFGYYAMESLPRRVVQSKLYARRRRPMKTEQLIRWVDQPETHQKIVGDYEGGYALGVTDNPPAFLLRVTPADVSDFPSKVNIHGVEVPVIVQGNFVPPVPINHRRPIG